MSVLIAHLRVPDDHPKGLQGDPQGDLIGDQREDPQGGPSVTVFDFDGPRDDNGKPIREEVTVDYLRQMINDPKYPFGHGYIVAGLLKGIAPHRYTD